MGTLIRVRRQKHESAWWPPAAACATTLLSLGVADVLCRLLTASVGARAGIAYEPLGAFACLVATWMVIGYVAASEWQVAVPFLVGIVPFTLLGPVYAVTKTLGEGAVSLAVFETRMWLLIWAWALNCVLIGFWNRFVDRRSKPSRTAFENAQEPSRPTETQ